MIPLIKKYSKTMQSSTAGKGPNFPLSDNMLKKCYHQLVVELQDYFLTN
jgi:hypothetical protein